MKYATKNNVDMLFQTPERNLLIEKMILLCERIEKIENKHNVFIIVPKKYIKYFEIIGEAVMINGHRLEYISGIENTFMGIALEFEDVEEPYIKIK